MDYDIVIAGAGPIGLLLACELRLAGESRLRAPVFVLLDSYLLPDCAG